MKQISTIKYKKIWHENNYPIEQHIQNIYKTENEWTKINEEGNVSLHQQWQLLAIHK